MHADTGIFLLHVLMTDLLICRRLFIGRSTGRCALAALVSVRENLDDDCLWDVSNRSQEA
jgi:hypothetical protein